MRTCRAASGTFGLAAVLPLAFVGGTQAANHYVDVNSTNATPPYTNWTTAATNIQDAVDAAAAGDEIVVTNGTYAPVTVLKPIAVRSVNGPQFTTINGGGPCVYLATNASLSGFTLTNGYSRGGGGAVGGTLNNCTLAGNWSDSGGGASYATLNNCTLTGNSAREYGGGAYRCTLNNCTLTGNSAYLGGGANSCTLNNCTLTGNSVNGPPDSGGGALGCSLTNCVVYFNRGANCDSSCTLNYSCTTPLPASGVGNISSDPQLASASRLSAFSPCIGKGYPPAASGTDIDGEPWANPPSIGCDEYHAGAVTGPLTVGITASLTRVLVGYSVAFTALIDGPTDLSAWDFGDGTLKIDEPYTTHSWSAVGDYVVSLWAFSDSYPGGISATVTIHVVDGLHYVAANSTNPVAPYASWATAATNIQDAIAAAEPGATVMVVSNGSYGPINIPALMTVRSVSGPQLTTINGGGWTRCASLATGATLSGFTLTNGSSYSGGGVYCESAGVVSNCVVVGNSAGSGGGAYGSTLNNCTLTGNSAADRGGGAEACTLNNCTLTGNSAYSYGPYPSSYGGGASSSTLNNCIVYFNTAPQGPNYDSSSTLNYCCTTPQPTIGVGNISLDPQLANSSHLSAASPCRGAGNAAYASGTDIDGEAWLNPPSIGCDEYHAHAVTGPLSVAISSSFTNVAIGFTVQLTALIDGPPTASIWDFGDGNTATNEPYIFHAWTAPGDYAVVLRAFNDGYPGGISATVTVHVVNGVHYVAAGSANPVAPYTSWATAATNIQDAVDAASVAGALVLVTNGIYPNGGLTLDGAGSRVAVNKPLSLQSVNGPQFTVIDGARSVRCVYLANGASLSGFTLTNGDVGPQDGGGVNGGTVANCVLVDNWAGYGGGASGSILNNCALTNNSANDYGGGAYRCALNGCSLARNFARDRFFSYGGGASSCTLNNCTLAENGAAGGGGASDCTLNNCTLTANSAPYNGGGGAFSCTLNNCALSDNSAVFGGGAVDCALSNCTLTANSAALHGGGAAGCTLNNCTLDGNLANSYGGGGSVCTLTSCALGGNSAYYEGGGAYSCTLNDCTVAGNSGGGAHACTLHNCISFSNQGDVDGFSPGRLAGDNWIGDPWFVAGSLRLQSNSPCINAGNNAYAPVGPDLDGNPRIAGGMVDIGAYEFQAPVSMISYAWLQQYGLPINGSTDTADPDGDGVDNYHEWLAATNPTNPLSSPAQLTITPSGPNVTLTWSSNAVGFALQSTTNLIAPSAWVTNAPVPVVVNGLNTVTNPITGPQQFYRLIH